MNAPPQPEQRVRQLVQAVYHEEASVAEMVELRQWIEQSEEAAWIFAQYMGLFAGLNWDQRRDNGAASPSGKAAPVARSPVLGFLGDCVSQGLSFLAKSSVFTLLIAVGLPAVMCLLLVAVMMRQPVDSPARPQASASLAPVATVARVFDCVGQVADGAAPLTQGTHLAPGERLVLRRGLIEIEFEGGAWAILEAPTTFVVRDANSARLEMGRLSATVPPRARGFAIETPLMTVVDLGTEFGVSVTTDGTTEAHVFKGLIEVALREAPGKTASPRRLRSGEAARALAPEADGVASFATLVASADDFVLEMPSGSLAGGKPGAAPKPKHLIASVKRHGSITDNRAPVGAFDGQTSPLAANATGLQLDALVYSDRLYAVTKLDPALAGAEFVRTFNSDRRDETHTYDVTFNTERPEVFVMVLVDERDQTLRKKSRQTTVDQIVSTFSPPGSFADTGFCLETDDPSDHKMIAVGKTVPTRDASGKPVTYSFLAGTKEFHRYSHYLIAVLPDAPSAPKQKSDNIGRD